MVYEHFGVLLRELRESRGFTREQLSNNICTPKQIYRIEKGDFEPSLYLLNQLSIKFNMDLNEYFKMHFASNTILAYEGIKQINDAISNNDLYKLKNLIAIYEEAEEFYHGENLQHILYGKALCSALLDKNYELSLHYCIEGIQVECPDFSIDNISLYSYSNVGLSILNCISCNYFTMDQQDKGLKVLFDILFMLEKYVLSSPYPMYQASQYSKKIYQGTINNICYHLMSKGDIKNALYYIDIGIDFSIKEDNLFYLPELYHMKFRLLYATNDYDAARKYYNIVLCLFEITKQDDKLKLLKETTPIEFPKILGI